ncbi:MAG: NAD-dependent epimerase/dehydratase family protein [Candidatus Aenigmarchaeota archaeon]|nr:NAD-dependent epimerase/dehydratase family protein [Candidatus Aenigmarchaeota archaeon]
MLRDRKILITGGAGFIGSHLVNRLEDSNRLIILDNLRTGKIGSIEHLGRAIEFHKIDLLKDDISEFFRGVKYVFHLAADADVKTDLSSFNNSFDQNFTVTRKVAEESRKAGVKNFCFASSSAVYGEAKAIPTPESYGPLKPISIYGASKLACEALLSGYSHYFGINCLVLRLANVIGNGCHGIVPDFVAKLRKNSSELEILGDGKQKKSYIYIEDCIDAMLFLMEKYSKPFDIFNLGSEDDIIVKRIAEIVSQEMGVKPRFRYTGGPRGWKGDVPLMRLDITKMKKLTWKPRHSSEEAVRRTVKDILKP